MFKDLLQGRDIPPCNNMLIDHKSWKYPGVVSKYLIHRVYNLNCSFNPWHVRRFFNPGYHSTASITFTARTQHFYFIHQAQVLKVFSCSLDCPVDQSRNSSHYDHKQYINKSFLCSQNTPDYQHVWKR